MKFTHIHNSSRFSRSAASLERATDSFYKRSSIVTFTEVGAPSRKRAPYEAGWGYYNPPSSSSGYDECGIAWDLDVWMVKWKRAIKVSGKWITNGGGWRWPIVTCNVLLKHKTSGHTILVSVAHMPNKIGGSGGFKPQGQGFAQRKATYINGTKNWNTWIVKAMRENKPDLVLVCADWNLNFRHQWVRTWLNTMFRQSGLKQNWKRFTGRGTFNRSVIDGSLIRGLKSPGGSFVISDVSDSTDHTPYMEHLETTHRPRTPLTPGEGDSDDGDADGGGGTGTPWWNFEDYGDETIYEVERV